MASDTYAKGWVEGIYYFTLFYFASPRRRIWVWGWNKPSQTGLWGQGASHVGGHVALMDGIDANRV